MRFIGLAGHSDLTALAEGIETGLVDVVHLSAEHRAPRGAGRADPRWRKQHDVGLVVMKPVVGGHGPARSGLALAGEPAHPHHGAGDQHPRAAGRWTWPRWSATLCALHRGGSGGGALAARAGQVTCRICDRVCQPVCEAKLTPRRGALPRCTVRSLPRPGAGGISGRARWRPGSRGARRRALCAAAGDVCSRARTAASARRSARYHLPIMDDAGDNARGSPPLCRGGAARGAGAAVQGCSAALRVAGGSQRRAYRRDDMTARYAADRHPHPHRALPGVVGEALHARGPLLHRRARGRALYAGLLGVGDHHRPGAGTPEAVEMVERARRPPGRDAVDQPARSRLARRCAAGRGSTAFYGIKIHPCSIIMPSSSEALDEVFACAREHAGPSSPTPTRTAAPMGAACLRAADPRLPGRGADPGAPAAGGDPPGQALRQRLCGHHLRGRACVVELGVDALGPDKILFGSDAARGSTWAARPGAPAPPRSYAGLIAGLRERGISEAALNRILYQNARAIFGIR